MMISLNHQSDGIVERTTNNVMYRHYTTELPVIISISLIGLLGATFNIFTILIILHSKKLRRAAIYLTISILLGAALQSLLSLPLFILNGVE